MKYNFEEKVIDVILNTIKDNQVYLTQPENLPQLAKLGYMYNSLWYAGRICWGFDGIIKKSKNGICEDNPKYKIEMCNPQTKEIDSLIYDAWGMHITEGGNPQPSWENFSTIVLKGKSLTDIEIKQLKLNKTIDDWVDIFTSDDYTYKSLFGSRRSVLDYLLCTIGTGYGFKGGCVYEKASGADEDTVIYGDWKNAVFNDTIQQIVNNLMSISEVEETVQQSYLYINGLIEKRKAKQLEEKKKLKDEILNSMKLNDLNNSKEENKYYESDEFKNLLNFIKLNVPLSRETGGVIIEKYKKYYPICDYSNISKIDENSDISYIKAGLEICNEILQHTDNEEKDNVDFATSYVERFKKFNN